MSTPLDTAAWQREWWRH